MIAAIESSEKCSGGRWGWMLVEGHARGWRGGEGRLMRRRLRRRWRWRQFRGERREWGIRWGRGGITADCRLEEGAIAAVSENHAKRP